MLTCAYPPFILSRIIRSSWNHPYSPVLPVTHLFSVSTSNPVSSQPSNGWMTVTLPSTHHSHQPATRPSHRRSCLVWWCCSSESPIRRPSEKSMTRTIELKLDRQFIAPPWDDTYTETRHPPPHTRSAMEKRRRGRWVDEILHSRPEWVVMMVNL